MPLKRYYPPPLPGELRKSLGMWERKKNRWKRVNFRDWENPNAWHWAAKKLNRLLTLDRRARRVQRAMFDLEDKLFGLFPELENLFFQDLRSRQDIAKGILVGEALKSTKRRDLFKAGTAIQRATILRELIRKKVTAEKQREALALFDKYFKAVKIVTPIYEKAAGLIREIDRLDEPLRSELFALVKQEKIDPIEREIKKG